jgi:hypothetical protein
VFHNTVFGMTYCRKVGIGKFQKKTMTRGFNTFYSWFQLDDDDDILIVSRGRLTGLCGYALSSLPFYSDIKCTDKDGWGEP